MPVKLISVLEYKNVVSNPIMPFGSEMDKIRYDISSTGDNISINLSGEKDRMEIEKLYYDILSVMFLCLGCFPHIKKISIDGGSRDIQNRVRKFTSDNEFFKKDYVLHTIDDKVINNDVISSLRRNKQTPLYSLQYIVSNDYRKINITHRLLLLLHVLQGIVDKETQDETVKMLKSSQPNMKTGKYYACAYIVCHRCIELDKKHNCEVLSLLGLNEWQYYERLTDTRDWYSHFNYDNSKKSVEYSGERMLFFFNLTYYMIRVSLLEKIGIHTPDKVIVDFFNVMHDWIAVGLRLPDVSYKSPLYRTADFFKKLNSYFR